MLIDFEKLENETWTYIEKPEQKEKARKAILAWKEAKEWATSQKQVQAIDGDFIITATAEPANGGGWKVEYRTKDNPCINYAGFIGNRDIPTESQLVENLNDYFENEE